MQAEVQRRAQETEKKLKELPHVARQHMVRNNSDCLV